MGVNDEMDGWAEARRLKGRKRRARGKGGGFYDGLSRDDILAVQCPECAAPPGVECARSRPELCGVSHYRRMLEAQGNLDPDQAAARNSAGWSAWQGKPVPAGRRDQLHPAITEVACPVHDMPRGVPCPRPAWPFCPARKSKLLKAALQQERRRGDRPGVVVLSSSDHAKAREKYWADTGPDECLWCWAASAWRMDPSGHDCAFVELFEALTDRRPSVEDYARRLVRSRPYNRL